MPEVILGLVHHYVQWSQSEGADDQLDKIHKSKENKCNF